MPDQDKDRWPKNLDQKLESLRPIKFREHMLRPEAYPAGWTTRKYFPPRAPRPPVPELHPSAAQPPVKKANLAVDPDLQTQ